MNGRTLLLVSAVSAVLALSGCQSTRVVVTSESQRPAQLGVGVSIDLPCERETISKAADRIGVTREDVREMMLDFTVEFTRRFLLSLLERELGPRGSKMRHDRMVYRSLISAGVDTTAKRFIEPRLESDLDGSHIKGR